MRLVILALSLVFTTPVVHAAQQKAATKPHGKPKRVMSGPKKPLNKLANPKA